MIVGFIILGVLIVIIFLTILRLYVKLEGEIQALSAYAVAFEVLLIRCGIDKEEINRSVERALKLLNEDKKYDKK
jgi:hypothetical protein